MGSLAQAGGEICITTEGGDQIDCVTYPAARTGESWSLCGDRIDPTENDDPGNWFFDDQNSYFPDPGLPPGTDGTDYGTPGEANPNCQ